MRFILSQLAFFLAVSILSWTAIPAKAQNLTKLLDSGVKLPTVGDQRTVISASLGKDVGVGPYSVLTLSEPQWLTINAQTHYPDAEGLEWEVLRVGSRGGLLPRGSYPEHTRVQFKLDLATFLPAQPPAGGQTYLIRARARNVEKRMVSGPIGFWSEPLVIHYATVAAPPTKFEETARYRRIRFVLDDLELKAEQKGDGKEEFRVLGFAREFHLNSPVPGTQPVKGLPEIFIGAKGVERNFGIVSKTLKPPHGKARFNVELDLSKSLALVPNDEAIAAFDLGNTGNFNPRRFLFAVSLMERDGGGEIQAWYDSFKDAREELDGAKFDPFDRKAFEKQAQQLTSDMASDMVALFGEALTEGAVSDPYSLFIKAGVAAVTLGVSAAVDAEKDDYYGTRAMHLDVMSNRVDLVHQYPGKLIQTEDGPVYRLAKEEWQFSGPPVPMSATSWDGLVELDFYIEFYDRIN